MNNDELVLYERTIKEIQHLLDTKDRLGVANLPLEFSGFSNDILYDEGTRSPAFVHLVDELVQDCEGKEDGEIVARFELLNKVLTTIHKRTLEFNSQHPENKV